VDVAREVGGHGVRVRQGARDVAAQVEIELTIESKLKAVYHIQVSSA
jgi:hypothetical protein